MANMEKSESVATSLRSLITLNGVSTRTRWLGGIAAVIIVLVVSLLIWGSDDSSSVVTMEFPTTVSTSKVGAVTLERRVRDVTAETIDSVVNWITGSGGGVFDGLTTGIDYALLRIENALKWTPWPAIIVGLGLLSFAVGRTPLLAFTVFSLLFVGFMDLWENTLDTIALMTVAVSISVSIGLPLGVLAARNQVMDNLMRPFLDGMQTMPSFVYLLPGVLFFGLGKPAGIFATIIYAVPPVIRLTSLGIRQVDREAIEAARAFGTTPFQLLTKVQVPMALPTIMAGINQTTMMALAMVTIASMVAAGGLGDNVLRALQKNEPGNGAIAGLAIVFLAIVIDRLTQSIASRQQTRPAG